MTASGNGENEPKSKVETHLNSQILALLPEKLRGNRRSCASNVLANSGTTPSESITPLLDINFPPQDYEPAA